MQVFFLFLESLGTPEMILIALVALIIFGPRKLPSIGRTIGKYTAEFKRASNEFRETFEREVQMAELEEKQTTAAKTVSTTGDFNQVENTIGRSSSSRFQATTQNENFSEPITEHNSFVMPEIRVVEQADFAARSNVSNQTETAKIAETVEATEISAPPRKRDWL